MASAETVDILKFEVIDEKSGKLLATFVDVPGIEKVIDLKKKMALIFDDFIPPIRQRFKLNKGDSKFLRDDDVLREIGIGESGIIYFRDLGPQVSWETVFYAEYSGPIFMYLLCLLRPSMIYGNYESAPYHLSVKISAFCWMFHYIKRLIETKYVHKFSNLSMPMSNLFKNCTYYWGFAFFIGYYVNHPLYTPPYFGTVQIMIGFFIFLFAEFGNLSIHLLFSGMRERGSAVRVIPYPNKNGFTLLFNYVSCPNYTYEVLAWIGFSIMCQSITALLFTFFGFIQMSIWAVQKNRRYRKEFKEYPVCRKAIIPYIL